MINLSLNINIIIIFGAFIVALLAVYALYTIIIPKDNIDRNDKDFQLSTKNILEHVQILFEKGEYALVQLLAMKYLERNPRHKEVRRYLANAYYKDRKYNNAIKQCSLIIKSDPKDFLTKKILADCYYNKMWYNKAIKEYEELYEHDTNNKDTIKILAELYRETEQIYSSISAYNALAEITDDKAELAEIHRILAELNEEIRDYPAAFESYKARLEILPTDYETNKKLVQLYLKLENYQKAHETLMYMLSFVAEPKNLSWIYENLINLFVNTEEYEKAIEYSNKLLDIQGSDKFKIKNNIARYYIKLGNYGAGLGILEDLVMMSQSAFDITVELAKAYIEKQEYHKAYEKYTTLLDKATQKEAKEVRSLICELYIKWADSYYKQADLKNAEKYLNLALDYNISNPEVYYHKALINYESKNYMMCVDLLNRAIDYDKNNEFKTKYLTKLSEAHHELGNFFEERKALSDLLKLDAQNPLGLYRSGLMYISQHDTKNAEEYFLKALENDPTLLQAKYNLALLYESNDPDRARCIYREILDADPNYPEVKAALNDLESNSTY